MVCDVEFFGTESQTLEANLRFDMPPAPLPGHRLAFIALMKCHCRKIVYGSNRSWPHTTMAALILQKLYYACRLSP